MPSARYVLFAAFAVCAVQAAEIQRSADKVELCVFVENGAAIARNLFKAVNAGLDQSKPNVDKIVNELAPEARTLIRRVINETRTKINEEEKRVSHIFSTLSGALEKLKPIKACSDKVSPAAKKLALAYEKEIAKIVQGVETKYKKEIEGVKTSARKTLEKARTLFDREVAAFVKCLTPGRKDADACLEVEIQNTLKGVSEVVVEVILLSQTADELLSPILPEVLQKVVPLLQKLAADGRVLLKTLADCVGTLKPLVH